ncbi:MAG: XdhC/CoxI family protein [Rhodospirillum sp.]|nr:XdhC/CoxI family protein [Rhodospirillum sp.]MCF8489225.1 XdhC/CoxI family protein [Rhodospirillum sp.]MCF8502681.1 XdhC/CoxI family protein [Rhodospirillum sp.]
MAHDRPTHEPSAKGTSLMDVFKELIKEQEEGRPCALATIVNAQGSIPASNTAKMLVREDGSIAGTVGGGLAEGKVIAEAREIMKTGTPRMISFNLHDNPLLDSGMVCGGSLDVFVEPYLPAISLYLFGGGHVGLVTAEFAHRIGYEVEIIDDRPEFANAERFPWARKVHAGPWSKTMAGLAPNSRSMVFIATHGHVFDAEVLTWAVTTSAGYIGMIGSKRKIQTVRSKLLTAGTPSDRLNRVHAPVGLDIGADTPEEIAVAVLAEMIAHVRGGRALKTASRTISDLDHPSPAATIEDGDEDKRALA